MARLVRLSVLESYGVVWSRETLARDLLQNFFDATGDFRKLTLRVDREAREVEISGSDAFDLELLCYIGATTKQDGTTVGGFGEGFKVCALVATRDYGVRMTAGSGRERLEVVFEPVPLGRELCYRVEEAPQAEQAWVRLEGCDAQLMAAFERGPDQFRHPDHPGLQEPCLLSEDGKSGFYWSSSAREGLLFYRRQRRGQVRVFGLEERGWTVVHDEVVEALEGDRDRRDISAYELIRAVGHKLEEERLWAAIWMLQGAWAYGGEALVALLAAARERGLKRAWPPKWVARGQRGEEGWEALATRQGYKLAIASFHAVGMRRAEQLYSDDLETRAPTAVEQARYDLLKETYRRWTSSYTTDERRLEVFAQEGAAIQGQFMTDRVLIAQELLAGEFAPAAGTILHELAHEAGGEESERFLRRLELLLYSALLNQGQLVELERAWEEAGEAEEVEETAAAEGPAEAAEEHPYERQDGMHTFYRSGEEDVAVFVAYPPGMVMWEGLHREWSEGEGLKGPMWWIGGEVKPAHMRELGLKGLPAYCVNGVWMEGEVEGEVEGCALLRYDGGYVPRLASVLAWAAAHPVGRHTHAVTVAMGPLKVLKREARQAREAEAREVVVEGKRGVWEKMEGRLYGWGGLRERLRWVGWSAVKAVAIWRALSQAEASMTGAQVERLCEAVIEEVGGWGEQVRWSGEGLEGYEGVDEQDRQVLSAARGAALYVWRACGGGEQGGRAAMELVWRLWQELLWVDLDLEVKRVVLEGALELGWASWDAAPEWSEEGLRARLKELVEEAMREDRRSFEWGSGMVVATLQMRWGEEARRLGRPQEEEDVKAAREAQQAREREEAQRERRAYVEDVCRTWEEALAASGGDERAGLEACIRRWWSVASEEVA